MAKIEAVAAEKGCTPSQVTLAWLLAQGPDVVAIPGTRYASRLDENVGALKVKLSARGCGADFRRCPGRRGGRDPVSGGWNGGSVHLRRKPPRTGAANEGLPAPVARLILGFTLTLGQRGPI